MRQLSKRTQYSLRALYALARDYGKGPTLISDLSEHEAIPKKFLEQILLSLKGLGLVSSKKGKGGGYFLARPPHSVSVGQIVRLIDGPLAPLPCVSRTSYMRCHECRDERSCGIRIIMKDVRDATASILDSTTLADVLKRVEAVVQGKEGLHYAI